MVQQEKKRIKKKAGWCSGIVIWWTPRFFFSLISAGFGFCVGPSMGIRYRYIVGTAYKVLERSYIL